MAYGEDVRRCSNSCGSYDSLNQCCWIVSDNGLFSEVSEGDLCKYGKKEGDL